MGVAADAVRNAGASTGAIVQLVSGQLIRRGTPAKNPSTFERLSSRARSAWWRASAVRLSEAAASAAIRKPNASSPRAAR